MYTFILDLNGGTFISQFKAVSLTDALVRWSAGLDSEDLQVPAIVIEKISQLVLDEKPILLKEMTNVWCCNFLVDEIENGISILNIVKTDISNSADI